MASQVSQALMTDTGMSGLSLTGTYANGLVVTAANATLTSGASVVTLLGANENLTETGTNATVVAMGTSDSVTTAASRIAFIAMGQNETLTETSANATIVLDPTQAVSANSTVEIDASNDVIQMQRLATVLTGYSSGWGGWGCSSGSVPHYTADVTIDGDHNLVTTGSVSVDLDIDGHFNVVQGGSGAVTVSLDTNAAAANVVIGGSGSMDVTSTAVATKVIGGSGCMNVDITGDAASVFGGSGSMNATIHGNGGDYQTGSGNATISFTGFGGVFATGGGVSTINYTGSGGLLYEANAAGSATFEATGNGLQVYGGDCVDITGNGNEVYTRDGINSSYPASYLTSLFTSGINSFLPNATIAAALAATGDTYLPSGVTPTSAQGSGGSCGSPCGGGSSSSSCGTPPRVITFQGDGGAVHTGDRLTYVTLTGNNDSVYTGKVAQYVRIAGGSGDGIYAGQGGGNSYYDGGPGGLPGGTYGQNYLDYQGSATPVFVNLAVGLARNGYGGIDTIRNLNRVDAGAGSTLVAGRADATLTVHGASGVMVGGAGNDTLHGTGAGTSFITGAGSDMVKADAANDSYIVYTQPSGAQAGTTTIDQAALGVTGSLTFANVASPQQFWLHQDASNDLVVSVLGSSNAAVFEHWFATDGTGTQLARLSGTSGWLDNAGINTVQQAMASYEASHPGFNPATATALPSDASAVSAAFGASLHTV